MHCLETRPAPDEYAPFYAPYIARVPPGDLADLLAAQGVATQRLIAPLDEAKALHRYGPGKWSVKEVIGHITDAERVFAYRAMRFARGDATPLSPFDETAYVSAAGFDRRRLADLLAELAAVRGASHAFFSTLSESEWRARGTASGHGVTVRALGCIAAGHELHHLAILRERYGVGG